MGLEKREHSELLQELISVRRTRELIPKDILSECKPGCPAVLISVPAQNAPNLVEHLKRKLRDTDLIQERNGIITIFALIRNREDITIVTDKVEKILDEYELKIPLSITYLDL